ncbi:Ig-like domain-containing protein [Methanosphaera sp. BMS]|uniref:beta strand repeat-containing protein n=1 Tax=Methanosphaera sp. BMS TaxID=1789762 RepID=UPI000DC1E965|nr:Ig-like domain-containing protein [Methanosphaera sp. BMS]AWX32223.1 hypothetical protein AW729_03500 [Methanosphaera sp. BMS]
MHKNIKRLFLLTTVLMLLVGIAAVSAVDDADSDVAADTSVSVDDAASNTADSAVVDKSISNNINKNVEKQVKKDATTHIVNNDNVDEIFGGEKYSLSDSIAEGDILDFQGTIDKNHSLEINKPVNVISSTQDAVISLHTKSGSLLGENPGNLFAIRNGASGSNISGLYLYNTECWVHNLYDSVLYNMTMYVKDASVGGGVGQTSLRYCNNVTMDSCTIYTENNGGSSSFVWTGCNNCTIINCTVQGEGNVGNLLYVGNPYNTQDMPAGYTMTNFDNNVINCTVIGGSGGISNPLQNMATRTLIKGNKFYSGGSASSGTNGTFIDNEFYRTVNVAVSANGVFNGNVHYGTGKVTLQANVTANNNTLFNVTLSGANISFTNSIATGLTTVSQPINLSNLNLSEITISSNGKNSNITNNNITGAIAVSAANVTIKDNLINTTNETAVVVTTDGVVVANNTIYAAGKAGNDAVKTTKTTTVIEDNQPTTGTFTITDETYSKYFDENGKVNSTELSSFSTLILEGTFNNKSFVFNDTVFSIKGNDAVLNNGQIVTVANGRAVVENVTFNNSQLNNSVIFGTDGNILRNSKIIKNFTNALAREVYITGNKNTVEYNSIDITGPSSSIDYSSDLPISPVIGIAILSSNNIVRYNNVTYIDTNEEGFGSTDLITINGKLGVAKNNNVTRNNLTAVGSGYLYGLSLGVNANDNEFSYNKVNIDSVYYSYGVNILEVPMTNNAILYNNITLKSLVTAYGVFANVWGEPEVSNFKVNYNNITVESVNAYGAQIAGSDYGTPIIFKNLNITYNNITVTGTYAMGVGLSMTNNVYLYRNTLKIYGETNETDFYSWDSVQPTTAGVYSANGNYTRVYNELNYTVTNGPNVIFKDMTTSQIYNGAFISNNDNFILENVENSNITNTKANTTSANTVDLINSNGNTIKTNTFYAQEAMGDNAVSCDESSTTNVITSNIPYTTDIIVAPEELYVNVENDITVSTLGSDNKKVNGTFAIYINGEQFAVSQTCNTTTVVYTPTTIGDLELTVEFIPSSTSYQPSTATVTIPVVSNQAVLNVSEVTANAGETVTLTTTVKDMLGNNINIGKVTFKVNGKTVKDANGKVIYAKVVDGVASVEYTVPEDLAGQNYTITAVYAGSAGFAKVQNTSTLLIKDDEASIEFENEPVTAKVGQTVTFTVKVTGDATKVVFKINGKSLKDANGKVIYAKVVDGIATVDYVIPEGMKAKDYTLSAVTMGGERLTAEQKFTITE